MVVCLEKAAAIEIVQSITMENPNHSYIEQLSYIVSSYFHDKCKQSKILSHFKSMTNIGLLAFQINIIMFYLLFCTPHSESENMMPRPF